METAPSSQRILSRPVDGLRIFVDAIVGSLAYSCFLSIIQITEIGMGAEVD